LYYYYYYLIGAGTSGNVIKKKGKVLKSTIFVILFQLCSVLFAVIELMVKEHNWADTNIDVNEVYPNYLFISTSFLFISTSFHLYSINVFGIYTTSFVTTIQGCKLLLLVGIPSLGIFSTAAVIFTYLLPFLIHCNTILIDGLNEFSGDNDEKSEITAPTLSPSANPFQIILYVILALLATFWAHSHIAYSILSMIIQSNPSYLQVSASCFAIFFLFLSTILLVFYRKAAVIRSIVMLSVIFFSLIATGIVGPPTLTIDLSSPYYFSLSMHPELATMNEDSGIYLIVAVLLLLSAQVNILAVKKSIPRLIFLLSFSYCAAKTSLAWAFPLALNSDSPQHGTFQLPWIYCLSLSIIGSSSAVHASLGNSSSISSWIFIISAIIPLAAVLFAIASDDLIEYYNGIIWNAIFVNSSIAIITRISEISRDIQALKTGRPGISPKDSPASASICVLASILGIFWTVLMTIENHHINPDFAIPMSCLLLLCTRKGIIVNDTHPLAVIALFVSIWWYCSIFYSIFIKGFGMDKTKDEFIFAIWGESIDTSIWTSYSIWVPISNIMMAFLPLPALILSYLRRKGESEDIMFVLAILCVLPIIGSALHSIRLLGLVGTIFASWRCHDVGVMQKRSDRLI
jgi:hypothetical protein